MSSRSADVSAAAPPPLALLPADGEQAAEARELALSVYDATGLPRERADAEKLPDGLRAAGGEFWVLTLNGTVAGTIGLRPGADGALQVCWWTVAPGNRRFGLGEWMLERAIAWARGRGGGGLTARVDADNRPAVAALRACHFAPPSGFDPATATGETLFARRLGRDVPRS